jgi:sortase A
MKGMRQPSPSATVPDRAPVGRARRRRTARVGLLLAGAWVLASCGSDAGAPISAEPVEAAAPTTTTTPPTTTLPPTTSTSSTTTTTSSTTTTTTTLPVPIPPPLDVDADEPEIELGLLEIPALDISMTMYEGIRNVTLDRGPAHWPGSAMPGQQGNVVVAGHRTSGHRVFRNVDRLVPGDELVFTHEGERFVYLVTGVEIVPPEAIWIVDQTPEYTATLFACHPPGSVAERIVVHAELADPPSNDAPDDENTDDDAADESSAP